MTDAEPALKRSLSLTLVTLYGLGNILGAGIYVLIGKVAANAGQYAPFSFLVASILAGLTAFTYAELSSRYPLSAGEAVYMQAGFNLKLLSSTVGLLIILAGIVSAATICRGFVGYFHQFVPLSETFIIVVLVSVLGALAAWGIVESVRVAALLTLAELFGLLLVLWVAAPAGEAIIEGLHSMTTSIVLSDWHGIMLGGMLAFYAYIGFEDMVNVAEEVRNPVVNLPRAILIALLVSTLLYMAVALVAITSVPVAELANSDAPLAFIYQRATGNTPVLISTIAMFAVVNGALIQIIMASRVCYGLSRQGWLPAMFSRVNPFTRTPLISTLLVSLSILIMALWLPIETLARGASLLLLMVFSLVNLALWRIKRRADTAPAGFSVPLWIPVAGFVSSTAFMAYQLLAGMH
jgi:basic amino acid/polyamine antiporter, APA family